MRRPMSESAIMAGPTAAIRTGTKDPTTTAEEYIATDIIVTGDGTIISRSSRCGIRENYSDRTIEELKRILHLHLQESEKSLSCF
jgi:hypothetical protein